jgi:hypothetical protein
MNIVSHAEGTVGEGRKFSFADEIYVIQEIIDRPEIKMFWNYDSGVCPHCKNKLIRSVEHSFYRVEILVKSGINVESAQFADVVCLGSTLDKRNIILTREKCLEIFAKSSLFRRITT